MKQAGKTVFRPGGLRAHQPLRHWVMNSTDDDLLTLSPFRDTIPKSYHSTILLEAILTHQPDDQKDKILQSLHTNQILLHDVAIRCAASDIQIIMQQDMTEALGTGFYAFTVEEWKLFVERNGYRVINCQQGPLANMSLRRLREEEGWCRTFRIVWNLITHPAWRQRVKTARITMKRYHESLGYILLQAVRDASLQ
jgi:hypothetical protein